MKNLFKYKKLNFWVMLVFIVVVILALVSLLTNPRETLNIPQVSSIITIEIEKINDRKSSGTRNVTEFKDKEFLVSALTGAKKTSQHSVNDYPIQSDYFVIRLNIEGEMRTLCLYNEGNSYYIEESYIGVYKCRCNQDTIESLRETYKSYSQNVSRVEYSQGTVAVSGNNQVPVMCYPSPLDISILKIKDSLYYLDIEWDNKVIPFHVYSNGEEQFGIYHLYDAETLEEIDFLVPSGLAPQTYILSNTKDGLSYIVTLALGEWNEKGTDVIGKTFLFGINVTAKD